MNTVPIVYQKYGSHDKVAELKEAFEFLDLAGDGFVDVASVKGTIASVIPGATNEVITEVLKENKLDGIPNMTFAQFYVVTTRLRARLNLEFTSDEVKELHTLHEVFLPFDKENTGSVDADVFMALMMEKGEKFTSSEAAEMRTRLERMGFMKKGRVNYRAFLNFSASSIDM